MTDFILGQIAEYGLWIVFVTITIGCMGIPLPAAAIVLTSGGFAAAGDMNFAAVVVTTLVAYVIGDQIAYFAARFFGPPMLTRLRQIDRFSPLVERGEEMLETKGLLAVFLSHTIISPLGPYVSYVCGATGMKWHSFTFVAVTGGALWTLAYALLGYVAADQLMDVSETMARFRGVGAAVAVFAIGSFVLAYRWRKFEFEPEKTV